MTQRLSGQWSGLIVYCAAMHWEGLKGTDQHIAQRLARHAPVLYVDPPVSVLARWRQPDLAKSVRHRPLRELGDGLALFTPTGLPAGGRRGVRYLTDKVIRRAIATAVKALGSPEVHAVVAASFAPVFGVCGERRRIFYSTDDFVAGADLIRVSRRALVRHEARQLREADTLVVCSPGLVDRYRSMGEDPILIANGCDDELFAGTDDAPWPADVELTAPVAGYVGHLSDRIDLTMLEAVADRGRSVLLVGPASPSYDMARLGSLIARPNVRWVGAKSFTDLPSYLRSIDVGLLPYGDSAFNAGSFPLKLLEYLAAGRGVVATDLPAVRWIDSPLIDVAATPEAFANAVDRALDTARTPELVADRRALARRHGWSRRAEEMAHAIGLSLPPPR